MDAMCRFDRSARLDPSQDLKQLRRLDFADRFAAKPWKYVLLEADECASRMTRTHLGRMDRRVPLSCHGLEAVHRDIGPARLLGLSGSTRINGLSDQPACLITLFPDGFQPCVRIGPERHQLRLAL